MCVIYVDITQNTNVCSYARNRHTVKPYIWIRIVLLECNCALRNGQAFAKGVLIL